MREWTNASPLLVRATTYLRNQTPKIGDQPSPLANLEDPFALILIVLKPLIALNAKGCSRSASGCC
jgi:hypothetical protein